MDIWIMFVSTLVALLVISFPPAYTMSIPINSTTLTTEDVPPPPTEGGQPSAKAFPPDCTLPAETGPCKAAFQAWYFNIKENKCLEFTYGGCDGNGNRYESLVACQHQCAQQTNTVAV